MTTVALAGKSFNSAREEALRALDAIEESSTESRPILLLHDDPTCKVSVAVVGEGVGTCGNVWERVAKCAWW